MVLVPKRLRKGATSTHPDRSAASKGRVLIVVTDTRRGGTPLKLATLARRARSEGWEICLISLMPTGPVLEELMAEGYAGASLNLTSPLGTIRACVDFRRLVKEWRPSLVQSALWHANALCKIGVIGTGIPVLNGHESMDNDKPRHQVLFDRLTRGLAASHYAVSRAVAERVSSRDGVLPERIEVIPVGLHVADWVRFRDRSAARAKLGLPRDAMVMGWSGRMHPVKNLDVLVEAIRRLPGWWAVLAGDGTERGRIVELAKRVGIADRVIMTGEVADVRPVLAAVDVFCLPSRWEGMPASLLEAMAMGIPVVASRTGGVPDAVSHGENGLLVDPGDVNALVRALERAGTDTEMGARGAETVKRAFSEDAMVRSFDTLWTAHLGRRERRSEPSSWGSIER